MLFGKMFLGENMRIFRKIFAVLLTLMLIFCVGCDGDNGASLPLNSQNDTSLEQAQKNVKFHFLDVGQGDSIFIELNDNRTMLIDAGESEYAVTIISYIKKLGYSKIDFVVATHPHSDHIGGMEEVINAFEIGSVYMPKVSNNTKTFEGLLTAIQNKGLKINTAQKGVKILDEQDIGIDVLSPVNDSYSNLNNYSVVLKITYKDNKFLFTGDAEADAESEIADDVLCDLVKVGHHGSNTSSGSNFVKATKAKYAVISCGTDNKYGHPHTETVNRWQNLGAEIYRTDVNGNIIATSDGKNITVTFSKNETVVQTPSGAFESETGVQIKVTYVLNVSSKKIHLADCRHVKSIKETNKKTTTETLSALQSQGYSNCKTCLGG